MIVFVTTQGHRYTHRSVVRALPGVWRVSYPVLFALRRLPRATYVFTDFDRLGFFQLEVAAHVGRVLREAGCRVLNDPARSLHRLALLGRLFQEGINSFRAWPAHRAAEVDRFPVFIRRVAAHRGVMTDVLANRAALAAALDRLLADAHPLHDLGIVEYRAEPIHGDVFRKLSFYRVGERFIPVPSVHERRWAAKAGEDGVAGAEAYAADWARMQAFPEEAVVRRAFEAGAIDYGRLDAGMVAGRLEVYEINTNPLIPEARPHPFAARIEAVQRTRADHLAAIVALDTPGGGSWIRIPRPPHFGAPSRWLKLVPGYQWMP